jgi:hypothetical protein
MKRVAVIGFAFLFAVATSVAQSSANSPASQQNAQTAPNFVLYLPSPTCPVSMHALQGSGTGLVEVRGDLPVTGFSQRIHLILTNPRPAKIAAAKVKVFGLSGKNRIEQASTNQSGTLDLRNQKDSFDLTRTLDVAFTSEREKDVATDLILPGFTTVRSIQLESLTYKDGSTWTFAGRQACYVVPDLIMLVATH